MWKSILAIAFGAAFGALLRWQLGERCNHLFPALPFGTLLANLIGAYLIGLAIAYLSLAPNLSPVWRLLIITGFCGGLTTFSSFSAEAVVLLQESRFVPAMWMILAHVLGSIVMTCAGLGTVFWLKHAT